jgi:hypothetical protein
MGAGCRCLQCRAANSRYETERLRARKAGEWNGLVDAGPVRVHLKRLARAGVGRRTVSEACDVGQSTLMAVKQGRKTQLRKATADRILAVTPTTARGAANLVPARATWLLLEQLLADGFTKAELARRLGFKTPALQVSRVKVTARTQMRVEKLWFSVMAE